MEKLNEFLENLFNKEKESLNEAQKTRIQELSGIKESKLNSRFAIQIFIETDDNQLLLEHEQYKKFRKSNALYYYHSEEKKIPVKAHYHIVDTRSKKEIYAVNTDGTAHHRKNKGFKVPNKQADELRALGVNFKKNNILESISSSDLAKSTLFTFFIIIEG